MYRVKEKWITYYWVYIDADNIQEAVKKYEDDKIYRTDEIEEEADYEDTLYDSLEEI